jgi:hypothetical protein
MSTPATPADSPSLEDRVNALEAENRDLRRLLGPLRLAGALLALGLIAYAGRHTLFAGPIRATVLDARQVIVRDPAGRVRLVLGTDDGLPQAFRAKDNPGLLLCDEKGALRAHLYASEELTGLGLYDLDGKPRAAITHRIGLSGIWLKDRGGAIRTGMALDASGGASSFRTKPSGPLCPCREYKVAGKAAGDLLDGEGRGPGEFCC